MPVDSHGNYHDSKAWRRKGDKQNYIRVSAPKRRYYPSSRDDLLEMVLEAQSSPDPKPAVRACGRHWALCDVAVTNDFFIETHDPDGDASDRNRPRLNRTLYDVVPECLSRDALRFFHGQAVVAFSSAAAPQPSKFYICHVEAGTRIFELYSRLDEGDDGEPRSMANMTQPHDLTMYRGPWAMATLGGAGGQTVAGAFSTGTHGADVHLPPIADAIQAIHLIAPGLRENSDVPEPKQYWIEKPLAPGYDLVDEEKIKALYPGTAQYSGIEVLRDPDLLNAVIVNAGRMGIIYSVVFRVVRQYALKEHRFKDTWSNVKGWIGNPSHANFGFSTGFGNRFVQVIVNPNRQIECDLLHPWNMHTKNEHSCFVTFRTLEPLAKAETIPNVPLGREERRGARLPESPPGRWEYSNAGTAWHLNTETGAGDFYNSICESEEPVKAAIAYLIDVTEDVRNVALITAGVFFGLMMSPLTLPPFKKTFEYKMMQALAVAALAQAFIVALTHVREGYPGKLGNYVGAIANWAAETDHMEILRHVSELGMSNSLQDRLLTAIGYGLLDIHDYPDIGCSAEGESLEVFFDHNGPNLVPFVEKLFQRMVELENGGLVAPDGDTYNKSAFPGYVSIRFMSRSAGLIAMQKWTRVCSLEIAGYSAALGTRPFLTKVEQDAIDMGGTVHWGQRNNLNMKQVEAMYDANGPNGPLFKWREALSRVSRNGRLATFSTEFTRWRGLEVVQPLVKDFTVAPTEACAGAAMTAEWFAADNPPGTQAFLVVKPDAGTPEIFFIGSQLEGTRSLVLPTGYADVEFTVVYELNGRALADSKKERVRGLKDHDVMPFNREATCWLIDGSTRWAGMITMGNLPENLLVEEVHCRFTGSLNWYVRKSGMPDLACSGLNDRHPLPALPKLKDSSWLFFVHEPGCGGGATPPTLHVEFKLVCAAS